MIKSPDELTNEFWILPSNRELKTNSNERTLCYPGDSNIANQQRKTNDVVIFNIPLK